MEWLNELSESTYRWLVLLLLLFNITMSGYHRRKARRESGVIARREEGARLVLARLVIVMPVMMAISGYVLFPQWDGWWRLPLPHWMRLAGLLLGLISTAANYWILQTLGSNISETVLVKSQHELVSEGPYRWVRHPLYSNGMVLCGALVLLSANLLFLILLAAFALLLIAVIIPLEEQELSGRFGVRYQELQQRTGKLWPRIGRR